MSESSPGALHPTSALPTLDPPPSAAAAGWIYTVELSPATARLFQDRAQRERRPWEEVIRKAFARSKAAADACFEGKAAGIAPTADVLEIEFVGLGC
jgi:hypothetical protein